MEEAEPAIMMIVSDRAKMIKKELKIKGKTLVFAKRIMEKSCEAENNQKDDKKRRYLRKRRREDKKNTNREMRIKEEEKEEKETMH